MRLPFEHGNRTRAGEREEIKEGAMALRVVDEQTVTDDSTVLGGCPAVAGARADAGAREWNKLSEDTDSGHRNGPDRGNRMTARRAR